MVICKNTTTNRNQYLDLVKSFAIICVIIGHCIQYGSGTEYLENGTFFDNPLFKFIYSFHMPLFMLISGYLFAFSVEKRSWKENIKRKITTLFIPILAWALVSLTINASSEIYYTGEVKTVWEYAVSYFYIIISSLWFLWAILYASLIIIFVKKGLRDSNIAYLILILISLFIPNMYNAALYSFMLPYYIIGYKFNIYNTNKRLKALYHFDHNRTKYILATCVIFFFLLYFYNYDSYIYTSGYCILNEHLCFHLITNIYRFTIGLIGSCFILCIMKYINKNMKNNMITQCLTTIGKETMGLYIISGYCFSYILPKITKHLDGINYGMLIIEVIGVLIISHITVKIIEKTDFTNKIFLGARKCNRTKGN